MVNYNMGKETSKAYARRLELGYFDAYLKGHGIDIGCGDDKLYNGLEGDKNFKVLFSCDGWDKDNGDAHTLDGIQDGVYDFVYSSHCLEHLDNPGLALSNWWRVLRTGGTLFIVVPDEALYEQGVWPSRGNGEHKTRWHINPFTANWQSSIDKSIVELVSNLSNAQIRSVQLIDAGYDYEVAKQGWRDQSDVAEVGIELIAKKL